MTTKHLIIGTGLTGQSIMQHLNARNIGFDVFDTREALPALHVLQSSYPNTTFYLKDPKQVAWDKISKVWVSPGISPFEEVITLAQEMQLPIGGDLELFAQQNINVPIIAITGTNGKSTLVTLITAILRHLNFKVALAGNIGEPMLQVDLTSIDYCVLELSSFQLYYQQSFRPTVACILNITEDHTDWHGSFEAYVLAKQKIYQYANHCVFNADDINTFPIENKHSKAFSISNNKETAAFSFDEQTQSFLKDGRYLFSAENLKLKGTHNYEDILAALAVINELNIDIMQTVEAIKNFDGLPHRTQFVREINGIKWINDSKGTNVGATLAAIKGLKSQGEGKIIWLAGGIGKGADFSPLAKIIAQEVRHSILFGKDKQKIANALSEQSPFTFADDLKIAITLAQQLSKPNDIVLFSPACASFDMFANYLQRGEIFMQMVHQIS